MSATWYAFFMFVSVTAMFIDHIGRGAVSATDASALSQALSISVLRETSFLGVSVPIPDFGWVGAVWKILTWDYYFLDFDAGKWVRLFIALPIQGIALWGFCTQIVPIFVALLTGIWNVIAAAGSGLLGAVRGLRGV